MSVVITPNGKVILSIVRNQPNGISREELITRCYPQLSLDHMQIDHCIDTLIRGKFLSEYNNKIKLLFCD